MWAVPLKPNSIEDNIVPQPLYILDDVLIIYSLLLAVKAYYFCPALYLFWC